MKTELDQIVDLKCVYDQKLMSIFESENRYVFEDFEFLSFLEFCLEHTQNLYLYGNFFKFLVMNQSFGTFLIYSNRDEDIQRIGGKVRVGGYMKECIKVLKEKIKLTNEPSLKRFYSAYLLQIKYGMESGLFALRIEKENE